MKACFAEVLAQEATTLDAVVNVADFDRWRQSLIDKAATLGSPYALALRLVEESQERAAFVERWQDLITKALSRVFVADTALPTTIEAHQVAVSILAALFGGTILSRVANSSDPLQHSVDLAAAPVTLMSTLARHGSQTGPPVP